MRPKKNHKTNPLFESHLTSRLYRSRSAREAFLTAYDELMKTWETTYSTRFVPTNFGETYVVESPPSQDGHNPDDHNGDTLLLIPGGQGTAGMWGPIVPILGTRHRVVCLDIIDQVGHSRPTRVLASAQDAADWIAQSLDGLGLQTVSLMGNSIGSFLAASFASKYPDRTRSLVLTAPAATFSRVRAGYIVRVLLTMVSPFDSTRDRFVAYAANGRGNPDSPLNQVLTSAMSASKVISKLTPTPLTEQDICSLGARTLAVFGEYDRVNRDTSRAITSRLGRIAPSMRTEVIADAGHNFTQEDLVACAKLASAFLREHP